LGKIAGLKCEHCGGAFNDPALFVCPDCGFPISITYHYDEVASSIDRNSFESKELFGIWRYSKLLPDITTASKVTLGEGNSPLVECTTLAKELDLHKLYAKLDSLNPTGSFKDRGSAVGVSFALDKRFNSVGCTSSGNMAASVAAYAAKAGLRSYIFVPPYASKEKLIQSSTYGATALGTGEMPSERRYDFTHDFGCKHGIFMINNNSPLRVEGQKTAAFEIWRDLVDDPPDWVVIPTSSGGNAYGIIKGFNELNILDLAERVPRTLIAQSAGCAPLAKAFKEGKRTVEHWSHPDSIASAILNPNPPSGERILKALAEQHGSAEMVSNEEIIQAMKDLATKEGVFCEPSSATSLAAIRKAVAAGVISPDESAVLDITGTGFKDLRIATEFYKPPQDLKKWSSIPR